MKRLLVLLGIVSCGFAMEPNGRDIVEDRARHVSYVSFMRAQDLGIPMGSDNVIVDDPTKVTHYVLTGELSGASLNVEQYKKEFVQIEQMLAGGFGGVVSEESMQRAQELYDEYAKAGDGAIRLGVLAHLQEYTES